jgi:hypothetical protein
MNERRAWELVTNPPTPEAERMVAGLREFVRLIRASEPDQRAQGKTMRFDDDPPVCHRCGDYLTHMWGVGYECSRCFEEAADRQNEIDRQEAAAPDAHPAEDSGREPKRVKNRKQFCTT